MKASKGSGSKFRSAVLCGVLSLLTDFILLPHLFTLITALGCPVPDPIWIPIMILIPVILAIHILERKVHIPAGYVWAGLPVQYLILIVFAKPISKLCGIGISGIRVMEYIWAAMVWPLSVTAAQFVSLIALRAWKAKRSK